MESIMVIIAAVVAALLVGPCVAVGAVIDARRVRALAALLRGRLEATSEELGEALSRAARAERELDAAKRRIGELRSRLEIFEDEAAALWLERAEAEKAASWRLEELLLLQAQNDALVAEVASLRQQRRHLVGQRNALALSARGLAADAEGASADAAAVRALYRALMSERGETVKRMSAADRRTKALEAFINRAYGPVDECEIDDSNGVW